MAKRMTKAEQMYYNTRMECRFLLNSEGFRLNSYGDPDVMCGVRVDFPIYTRTYRKAFRMALDEIQNVKHYYKVGLYSSVEEYQHDMHLAEMVVQAFKNTYCVDCVW